MSDATYQQDKYKNDILASAKKIAENSYYLPTEKMHIKLKPGVSLSGWVSKWIDYRYRNNITENTILI